VFNFSALQPLVESAPKRRYRKGTILIQEGDTSNNVYIVVTGSVRSYSASWDDKEITFGVYGPGTLFGEMSLDGGARSTSVETLETTECAVIEHALMVHYLTINPDMAFELIKLVIHRAREATQAARNMALMDVYGRIRIYLEGASKTANGAQRVLSERRTQLQIAQHVGASREMVNRIFKDLEKGQYISIKQGFITLHKALPEQW
jgi:CRP/FNR family transcriptional regulator, cyclic AMP receptor protein